LREQSVLLLNKNQIIGKNLNTSIFLYVLHL